MIAAGGTGGHVYPALAAAEAMRQQYPEVMLYFVGTVGGFERPLVERSGIEFAAHDEVQAGPLHGVGLAQSLRSAVKLVAGTLRAFRLLRQRRPGAILATGGWVSLPVALAARIQRIPLLIYLPDIEPGLTIKVLRRFADRVAVTVPESARYFKPGQTVVTGYPLRAHLLAATREQAVAHFGLEPTRQTLLIFGGSRGARAINIAVGEILAELLAAGIQVLHVTGELDWARSQEQIGALAADSCYHPYPYLHDDMGLALAAADLVVCRAGASVLGEFPAFHLPSILIPLAYSWRYQQVNADYLAERGAALHLDETHLSAELLPAIRSLFDSPERLEAMRSCAAALAQKDGAGNLAGALAQLARGSV
jgi:UDP-N-acetylglucosamine--N-acetylmuramyl-(pentapeptide) pyrophosphoryl-undecaprenol N-acetylglucosamine transferase